MARAPVPRTSPWLCLGAALLVLACLGRQRPAPIVPTRGPEAEETAPSVSDGEAGPEEEAPAGEAYALAAEEGKPNDAILPAFDDLPGIERRGVLRVLVQGSGEEYLPRAGLPATHDRQLARELAARRGLKLQLILVDAFDQLIPMLLAGKGDVIAANFTVTPARARLVDFTRPVAVVKEIVVGQKGAPDLPGKVAELKGRAIHVRPSSPFAESLARLKSTAVPDLEVVAAPETLDQEELAYQVSQGERPLTVIDSHTLQAVLAYNDRLQPLFPVAEGRQKAWAVRKNSPLLNAALDAFLVEKALTVHTEERFTGDLDGVRKRGVLRVITRNNPVTYFLHQGQQMGWDYTLARMLASSLQVRLEMVVPPSRDLLIPWLEEGRGDVIAASYTVTPDRAEQVAFSTPYLFVEEVLVQRRAGPKLGRLEELRGRRVHVRRSSSYFQTLSALKERVGDFEIVEEPEDVETEELIDRVGRGEIPFTVSDSHILGVELTYRKDVEGAFPLSPGQKGLAFAFRRQNPELTKHADAFVKRVYRGLEYNIARKRYFESKRMAVHAQQPAPGEGGRLSPYDELIRKYAARYSLDWRLLAAQAFQESRFDPQARSWVGAMGLFQVMPGTGRELGFSRLRDPEESTHAGVKYMSRLIGQFDPRIPFRQRVRFALAAYNAGYGHVEDARRLARERGLDPDRWFENVEQAMLLLERPRYYQRAKHGYCRGSEPVRYVSEIQNRYDNYVKLFPD